MRVQTGPPSAQVRSRTMRQRIAIEAMRRVRPRDWVLARAAIVTARNPIGARSRNEARASVTIENTTSTNQAGGSPVDEVRLADAGPGDPEQELLRSRDVHVDRLRRVRPLESEFLEFLAVDFDLDADRPE